MKSSFKILISTLLILLSNQYVSLAQDSTVQPENRQILILNKKYEPFKEINIGDFVRVILTNSTVCSQIKLNLLR
jgi:hypothetical protein